MSPSAKRDRDAAIRRCDELVRAGDLNNAAELLRGVLLTSPDDVETIVRYATLEASRNDFDAAIALLDSIPPSHPEAGFTALGKSALWCVAEERYDDAEVRYRKLIERAPRAASAHRQLANLLNRQGRRHEAAMHIRELCRIGDVREEELHTLLSLSDAVYDDPKTLADQRPDREPMTPIGPTAMARIAFTERRYDDAVSLLGGYAAENRLVPSMNAFLGRCLAEAQDDTAFLQWHQSIDESTKQFSEYWAGAGAYLIEQQRFEEATRALGEAVRLDSTDLRSFRRLHQSLVALEKPEAAEQIFDRYVLTRDVMLASNQAGESTRHHPQAIAEVINGLQKLGRGLEVILWQAIDAMSSNVSPAKFAELKRQRALIAKSDDAFASTSAKWGDLDLDSYPLPTWPATLTAIPVRTSIESDELVTPQFRNVADEVGLDHAFMVASKPQANLFAIFQSIGGGVAVIDFDLDGLSDLYLAQGGCDGPEFVGTQTNILYRSAGDQLIDVTSPSGSSEFRYTLGVTAGDWNQDGLPDLVLGNLGRNTLMINNGDGTFRAEATDPLDDASALTTSMAIADVTGDALPDIIELNYADDKTITKKPQRNPAGEIVAVMPLDFVPAADRVMINDGEGARRVESLGTGPSSLGTGLGVVIANFDGVVGNEIFVGNDVRQDRLWRFTPETSTARWTDSASLSGCAFGAGGAATASMGIAAADFDHSGTLDLYITNFENEPSSFFLNRGATFQDRSTQFKLMLSSIGVVGFGCQAIDYHNDGFCDLAVTNGHIEDTGAPGNEFKQPLQFFENLGNRFQETAVVDESGYCGDKHVGRALATLDFNRDGRTDFVVTHLGERTALVLNQTDTPNHFVDFCLVGTRSERDAVGGVVQIRSGDQRWTQFATAGDGFLCHNEDTLRFGIGANTTIDDVTVTWPSGEIQRFGGVEIDQRYILVEDDPQPFQLDR